MSLRINHVSINALDLEDQRARREADAGALVRTGLSADEGRYPSARAICCFHSWERWASSYSSCHSHHSYGGVCG
jgi:hypothetical protein